MVLYESYKYWNDFNRLESDLSYANAIETQNNHSEIPDGAM